jgi:hypothetical protein
MCPSTVPGSASRKRSLRERLLGLGLLAVVLSVTACSGKKETTSGPAKEKAPTKVVSKSPLVVTNADGSPFVPTKTFTGDGSGKAWEIPVGPVPVKGGKLTVFIGAIPGADCVLDYVRLEGADGKSVKVEAEDPAMKGDTYAKSDGTPGHWWIHAYKVFSKEQAILVRKTQGTAPVLSTTFTVPDGTYQLFIGSFQGDSSGPFAIGVRWE